jgi:hypothetical protein
MQCDLHMFESEEELVETLGWSICGFLSTHHDLDTSYMVTAGLTILDQAHPGRRPHPELFVTGLFVYEARKILCELAGRVRYAGATLHHGLEVTSVPWAGRVVLLDATPALASLPILNPQGYPTSQVRLLQAVWPEPDDGQLPWDPGFRHPIDNQPLYGRL